MARSPFGRRPRAAKEHIKQDNTVEAPRERREETGATRGG